MKIHINPEFKAARRFIDELPTVFAHQGTGLHRGRNTIRQFDTAAGVLVVKSFQRPSLWRAVIYTFLRKSKAQRSFEHAVRLRALGIDSPEPVAWSELFHRGVLRDSYYVSRRSEDAPLTDVTADPTDPAAREVLDAFARFAAQLHGKGVEHQDFNQGNILWRRDPADGSVRFQLIDLNRMRFSGRPLSARRCMVNLRRLSCPAVAFLYILDRYAEARGWNINDTLLRGTFFRLLFGRRKQLRKRFKEHICAKKSVILFGFSHFIATFANNKNSSEMRAYGFAYYFYYFFFYGKRKSGVACI